MLVNISIKLCTSTMFAQRTAKRPKKCLGSSVGKRQQLKGWAMPSNNRFGWPLAAALLLVGPAVSMAASADADTASSSGLEEIVVTATRRSERLQDVTVSVIAFNQEKLDAEGLK